MTSLVTRPTDLPSWQALNAQATSLSSQHLKDLFAADADRFAKFSISLPNVLFDYSKNLITEETKSLLLQLAKESDVESWRDKMFAAEHINATEDRAVMHVALRDQSAKPIMIDGEDARPAVQAELDRMQKLSDSLRSGAWTGFTQKTITDIVSIGIGGSNLGPLMVTEALAAFGDKKFAMHYVSNIDGVQIADVL